jgi:hypothetical protein
VFESLQWGKDWNQGPYITNTELELETLNLSTFQSTFALIVSMKWIKAASTPEQNHFKFAATRRTQTLPALLRKMESEATDCGISAFECVLFTVWRDKIRTTKTDLLTFVLRNKSSCTLEDVYRHYMMTQWWLILHLPFDFWTWQAKSGIFGKVPSCGA